MRAIDVRCRIFGHVDTTPGCWMWTGRLNRDGYGCVGVGRKSVLAHRASYEAFVGEIPPGGHVCHKCDNPGCVFPDHLFISDHSGNMKDMRDKGRGYWQKNPRVACKKGHPLTPDNVVKGHKLPDGSNHKLCRICTNEYGRNRYRGGRGRG